jgi:SAM-dependent methyltransferase
MANIKHFVKKLPIIKYLAGNPDKSFPGTANYWEERYHEGGNSGAGSYNRLAEFKADFLNSFINNKNIKDVIEFGCGDGNQAMLIKYPNYIGLDISKSAIHICIEKFINDSSKSFFLYDSTAFKDDKNIFQADLTLSLDVLYHIIEDDLFEKYMKHLFSASKKFVIIYSNDFNDRSASHVRERKFTDHVASNHKNWKLIDTVKNKYPFDPKDQDNTSSADFYIFEKI